MTTLVNEEESAIGFMPLSHVSNEVKALRLNGVAPQSSAEGNGRYPLTLEIRALAPERPGGETYEWLAWLQASLSMGTP
jgi:phosphate transport system substrate-binding protein